MKQNGPEKKFTQPQDIRILGEGWHKQAKLDEPAGKNKFSESTIYRTVTNRYEDSNKEKSEISSLHGESIIKEVIPKLLKELPEGQKLRILDNGTGVGIFTDQIRKEFGDKVDVYSTGLSKQAAREYRKKKELPKLGKNDLKWRSIQELSDYPEFNLIIDTYGEAYYRPFFNMTKTNLSEMHTFPDEFYKHLEQVIKKLLPGGYATITPLRLLTSKIDRSIINTIEQKFGVSIYWENDKSITIKIKKYK